MKKSCFPVIAALFLFGCASSERAFRMSGGVLDTYSAPKSYRTRSEKFQKMDQMSIPHRANKTEVAGINDTLVNIWPFYFRKQQLFFCPVADDRLGPLRNGVPSLLQSGGG